MRPFGLAGHDFAGEPRQILEALRGLGVTHLDFWAGNRGGLGDAGYRALLDELGMTVYTVNAATDRGRFGPPEQVAEATAAMERAIEAAVAFGAPYVQFYMGPPGPGTLEERVATVAAALGPVADRAQEAGVKLVAENDFDHRGEDPERRNLAREPGPLCLLVEAVGADRLGLTIDQCNYVMSGVDPLAAFLEMEPYLVNVHVKDCAPVDDPAELGEPEPGDRSILRDGAAGIAARASVVGEGVVDWGAIFAQLEERGFDGWVTLDPHCSPADVEAWSAASLAAVNAFTDIKKEGIR
jgi:sugar phosphate isomerase/epimerase